MKYNNSPEKLFFSYGHDKYTKVIEKIKQFFEENGYKILIDSELLSAGTDWEERLEEAINDNDKFIFFITKYSVRRPDSYCLNEISYAYNIGKEIIPVMLEESRPPLSIARIQYLDLSDLIQKNNYDSLLYSRLHEIVEVLQGRKGLDFGGRQAKLIASLDPIDFGSDFRRYHDIVGREWIIPSVDNWLKDNNSSVLWISADAGYGKSAIAAYLAQYHPKTIGIHFCASDSPEKNNPVNIIKTMAYHFYTQIEGYYDEIKDISIEGSSLDMMIDNLILTPLENSTKRNEVYIFIIDAVDEASKRIDGRLVNPVSRMIRDKFTQLPPNIRIIVTSRPEPYLRSDFSHLNPLELSMEDRSNEEDCRIYIQKKAKGSTEEYIKTLLESSRSNMLYLKSFFDAANNGLVSIDNPDAFPVGLNGMYSKYFDRVFPSLDEYLNTYAPMFEIIHIYGDRINRELLAAILNLTDVELNRRTKAIGSFLKEEEGHLYYYHKSLEDWLVSDSSSDYQIDPEKGSQRFHHFLLGLERSRYLDFSKYPRLNYHLAKYYYDTQNSIKQYLSITKTIGKRSNRIDIHLQTVEVMIEEKEYDIAKALLLAAEPLIGKESPQKQSEYLIKIIDLWPAEAKGTEKDIKKLLKALDVLIDTHVDKISDETIRGYSDILIGYSTKQENQSENVNIVEFLERNQERIGKRFSDNSEIASSYLAQTTAIGGFTVAILPLGAALGPVGAVVAGVAAIGAAFINFRNSNSEKIDKIQIKKYEQNIKILGEQVKKNPQKWITKYIKVLQLMLALYSKTGKNKKISKLLKESQKIVDKLYNRNPNRWRDTSDLMIVLSNNYIIK